MVTTVFIVVNNIGF